MTDERDCLLKGDFVLCCDYETAIMAFADRHQEKENKRILLTNSQRMPVAAKPNSSAEGCWSNVQNFLLKSYHRLAA
ncbi:MAG TPA: hypothetical protein VMW24_28140 [Sedimentisphaerales bacterium]|nr:hypothetical protein [Sedimentisphaerales bacterium]